MYVILSIFAFCFVAPGQPMSYPVFGTKRYHRATTSGLVPSSSVNSVPYYSPVQQYYDDQPMYVSPNYHHGYATENGYYYYPRHEYHSYGLPTYRGEYKPSPYYYAPGPSYSYYDDREVATNPLDDLHEEMLQEDERERQRELVPVGQENWFESSGQQDALTNNFLRNLIAYNRQINAQQQDQEQLPHQKQQSQMQADQPSEYDEYGELNPPEYEYEPQNPGLYDLKKYENQNPRDELNEIEDEEERQLKSLASSNENYEPEKQFHNPHHQEPVYQDTYQNWQPQQASSSYAQYDADPEYDDSWINWDRKRSPQPQKLAMIKTAFSDRKPSRVAEHFEKMSSTKKPLTTPTTKASILSTTTTSTTTKPRSTPKFSGQKEVVLPRPAAPQAQHVFASPVLDMISNNHVQSEAVSPQQFDTDDSKRSTGKGKDKTGNIYDTIKQLMAMEEQLEKRPLASKLQKRFVSNEENLVHELDTLKRRSV